MYIQKGQRDKRKKNNTEWLDELINKLTQK